MHADLEDYYAHHRYKDGLKKCEKLLKKGRQDTPLLLLYKAKFTSQLGQRKEAHAIIDSLVDRTPALDQTQILQQIDEFLYQEAIDSSFPNVLTNGPTANKLWNNCLAVTTKQAVHHVLQDRLEWAIQERRWQDVGTVSTADP